MGSILTNGVFLPAEGERNCYAGLAANWRALDAHLGNTDIHVTYADKQAWNGHVADTVKHVTASDKQTWNGKQDALSQTQLDAVNSGIDSSKVQQIATNTSDISSLQSGKANDSDVVHKSGNETISGVKTFTDNNMIKTSSPKVLLINTSQTGNTAPSSNTESFLRFDGGTVNNFGGVKCEFLTTGENRLTNYVNDITKAKVNAIQQRANSTTAMTVFNADLLAPATDGVTALGSSSKRLKDCRTYLINGLTPSSLSLPDIANKIDISSYITDLTGNLNTYTPTVNGWICIQTDNSSINNYISCDYDVIMVKSSGNAQGSALSCLVPVLANKQVRIRAKCTTLTSAYFVPCLGNV